MPLNRCIVAARLADPGLRPLVERRLAAIRDFFAPLGAGLRVEGWFADDRLLLASIDVASEGGATAETGLSRAEADGDRIRWWGEALPAPLRSVGALLGAGDAVLRTIDRCTVAAAVDSERLRVVTGAGAPSLLYAAALDGIEAWSTHATAASLVARGGAEVDPLRIPELLALGACVGDHAHLRGVTALGVATVIDAPAAGGATTTRTFFPRAERWAAPERPLEHAETALLETLDARLREVALPYVALTAGRDSAVAAAALKRLGRPFSTFTWGHEDWGEVREARRRAEILGVPHEARDADYRDGIEALERGLAEVRWTEGVAHLAGWGSPRWPSDMGAVVTGAGAEVGRAYYYAWCVQTRTRPRAADLAATLQAHTRLEHASGEARGLLRDSLVGWFEAAPREGWEALDVFYVEERMGRWGHAHLSRTAAPWVAAFPVPEVARALLALPRAERLRMAFHEHMTAGLGFDLPAVPAQRPAAGVPAVARRAKLALDRARARRAAPQPWFLAHLWDTRADLRDHVADGTAHPLIADALGADWVRRTRDGFLAGERFATERALAAAGVAAYAEAVGDLRVA